MSAEIGASGVLLYGTSIASMAVLNHVRDVDVALSCEAKDITPNDANGWRSSVPGDRELQFNWLMLWDNADAGQQVIRDAYLNDTPIFLWMAGGIMAECLITGCIRDERITSAIVLRVTAKPTLATEIPPTWLYDLIDGDVGGLVVDDVTGEPVQVAA